MDFQTDCSAVVVKNNMVNIVFITTYKNRDFYGNALIGRLLFNEYQINTIYSSGYNVINNILKHNPVAVVFDHLTWKHKIELLKTCQSLGLLTFFYPTEGYYKDMSALDDTIGLKHVTTPGFSKYFLWGEEMMARVKSLNNFINELDRFIVTGNARFDFYLNQKLKIDFQESKYLREKYKIDASKKIITYMSTAPYQGYEYNDFYRRYSKNASFDDEYIKSMYQDQQKIFRNHTKIIKKLSQHIDSTYIIFYKTHPSEAYPDAYNEYFGDSKNIILIKNEDVKPFLFESEWIIQRNCTTAVEAWLLGTKVIQLDDADYYYPTYEEHYQNSIICKDYKEILHVISVPKYVSPKIESFITRKFGYSDGESYRRIAIEISSSINTLSEIEIATIQKKINEYKRAINLKLVNIIKRILFIPNSVSLRPSVFLKKVTSKKLNKNTSNEVDVENYEVIEQYKKIDEILGSGSKVLNETTQNSMTVKNNNFRQN